MAQKTYKVTGGKFQGHEPGETFKAELDPGLEKRAIARGQIKAEKKDASESSDKEKE